MCNSKFVFRNSSHEKSTVQKTNSRFIIKATKKFDTSNVSGQMGWLQNKVKHFQIIVINLDFRLNWGQRHSRDNQGYLPWERDRWSRERSRSWSPNRYKKRRYSHSPKPKEIDERRIDKKELLALARKNATRLAMEGRLPKGVELGSTLKNKSVRELIGTFNCAFNN